MALLSRTVLAVLACAPLLAHAQPDPQPDSQPVPPEEPPAEKPTEPAPPVEPAPPQAEPAPPTAPDEVAVETDDHPKKKKKKKDITYDDNHWLVFHGPHHQKLRFRLYLEPMLRF